MPLTNYPNGVSSFGIPVFGGGIPPTFGNVYWVKKSTDPDYSTFVDDRLTTYSDGTSSIYNSIQAAVNAATDKRGDVIIVDTGSYNYYSGGTLITGNKWKENVVVNKASLKILAAKQGWETQMRPGDGASATKWSFTPTGASTASGGFGFYIVARSVEIAGFLVDAGGGHSGIYVGDGSHINSAMPTWNSTYGYGTNNNSGATWIHDCYIYGAGEGVYGVVLDGAAGEGIIERCLIEGFADDAIYILPGGARTTYNWVIRNNVITAGPTSYGVNFYPSSYNINISILNNLFSDAQKPGDGTAWNFADAILSDTGNAGHIMIAGNRFCTAKPVKAQSSDYLSGNSYFFAGSSTEANNLFIVENLAGAH